MDKGVGSILREARSRRKLSLQDVEAATKIRARYLKALENEDWDELPGDVYARAFVRTYASHLGLDADRLAEEVRRDTGSARPGDRLPRIEPLPRRGGARGARRAVSVGPRLSPRMVAAIVTALVVAALIAVGIAGGGGSGGGSGHGGKTSAQAHRKGKGGGQRSAAAAAPAAAGHELTLLARGEVWVCLLDGRGRPLLNGEILEAGERAGPFRSGSFTAALGNGQVTMEVDGKQASIAASNGPIGFSVGGDGAVSEIPEGERPTCT